MRRSSRAGLPQPGLARASRRNASRPQTDDVTDERDLVEGYSIDEPDLFESEFAGTAVKVCAFADCHACASCAFVVVPNHAILVERWACVSQVGFVAMCVGAVVLLLTLARPVIDNTLAAFPVRI